MANSSSRGEAGFAASASSKNFLTALPVELSSQLFASATTTVLKRGQILFERGDAGDGCYWINEGALKVSASSVEGAERILAILGPGSIVGEFALIDGLPRSSSVHALRDSNLSFIARSAFLECMRLTPGLYAYFVNTLVARLRRTDEVVMEASFLSIKARVARAFLQYAEHLGEPTTTPDQIAIKHLRQEDVAALADVARENVSRILSGWRKRKLISRESPSVYVILKSGLQREAGYL